LSLMGEGYDYIKNRCGKLQTDIFETRLLGGKVICMTGADCAKLFYDNEKFERKNVAPKRVQKTLFGENAIQGMDGKAHAHRKQLFISLADRPNQEKLAGLMTEKWLASVNVWENSENIVLFDEARNKLTQAACQWAGVPLPDEELAERADDFAAMVDSFGSVGPRHWKGRRARTRCEEWMRGIIVNTRLGNLNANEGAALHEIAFHKDPDGNPLDEKMAAVELINAIRPIVAISTYIAFMALALHVNPGCRQPLQTGDGEYFEMFVQEVRRFFPFTPFVGARVKQDFAWNNVRFPSDTLVLLDVYGTDHDPRIWDDPYAFRPERFRNWDHGIFNFIPHGGDPASGHRCPGEGITVEILKATLDFLVNKIEYHLPEQDLSYSLAKIPALPESKIILSSLKRK